MTSNLNSDNYCSERTRISLEFVDLRIHLRVSWPVWVITQKIPSRVKATVLRILLPGLGKAWCRMGTRRHLTNRGYFLWVWLFCRAVFVKGHIKFAYRKRLYLLYSRIVNVRATTWGSLNLALSVFKAVTQPSVSPSKGSDWPLRTFLCSGAAIPPKFGTKRRKAVHSTNNKWSSVTFAVCSQVQRIASIVYVYTLRRSRRMKYPRKSIRL